MLRAIKGLVGLVIPKMFSFAPLARIRSCTIIHEFVGIVKFVTVLSHFLYDYIAIGVFKLHNWSPYAAVHFSKLFSTSAASTQDDEKLRRQ